MSGVPHWMIVAQGALRSTSFVLAIIGIGFAAYDWRQWGNDRVFSAADLRRVYLPMFVLTCLVAVLRTPSTFSRLGMMQIDSYTDNVLGLLSLIILNAYFYLAMVWRLRMYDLDRNLAMRKAGAILAAIVLLVAVGFYGR